MAGDKEMEQRDTDVEGDSFEDADDGTPQPASTNDEVPETGDQIHRSPTVENDTSSQRITKADDTVHQMSAEPASRPMSPDLNITSTTSNEQQAPTRRKLFGWLSRNTSGTDTNRRSPSGRRDTVTSILSNGSGTEHIPNRAEEDGNSSTSLANRLHRNSLKDRFKLVRMREEAGIFPTEPSAGSRPGSPQRHVEDADSPVGNATGETATEARKRTASNASMPGQPTINVLLPPGTAAGTSAGPNAESTEPVDWDLWQEVVYEGPAAVARSSGAELTKATMRGIPSAIRGVVWQVLAQSKNEELESVYRDLVARRPGRRKSSDLKPRPVSHSRSRPEQELRVPEQDRENGATSPDTSSHVEFDALSASDSRRNSGAMSSPPTSYDEANLESLAKEQAKALEAEQKRQKEDNASLQKLERAIKRDLGARTSYSKFLMSAGLQDGLFGICKAYALFDEEVGYAQGMNFIAMPLLFNMVEEEAFCLFVRLMNNYNLRDLFVPEMPGLHLHLYQFERLLEDLEPAVYCHLHRRNVHPQLYATQWFLTLFAYRFPLQLVLRIYDLILSDGLGTAILKFGIVLMQKNADKLLEMKDMATLTTFLKERLFDYYIDKTPSASSVLESGFFGSAGGIDREVYRADDLVQDACAVNVSPEMLKAYTAEWQEKTREEKARLAADDALRTSNLSLTLQARQLSERCEQSDAEHVQLASELVHTKLENERLADENESLQGRVKELQAIVQAQPGEVEDKLRQEMDRIMKRNIEVQNENRALEDSQAEMEQALVETKLKHAEIQEELDNMRQKWSNVTHMMSGVASPPAT